MQKNDENVALDRTENLFKASLGCCWVEKYVLNQKNKTKVDQMSNI